MCRAAASKDNPPAREVQTKARELLGVTKLMEGALDPMNNTVRSVLLRVGWVRSVPESAWDRCADTFHPWMGAQVARLQESLDTMQEQLAQNALEIAHVNSARPRSAGDRVSRVGRNATARSFHF
eukprot:SAG11_NODE_7097_length_1194_cov_1.200913_2_plen_125_part_00